MFQSNRSVVALYEIANIDKFGRILIPKKMRAVLGLRRSGRVGIESRDRELALKPMHKKADAWAKQFFEETLSSHRGRCRYSDLVL